MVIHGMGQQRPMQTIRHLVRSVWSLDLSLTDGLSHDHARTRDSDTGEEINVHWAVPDNRTGSAELRRITTPRNDSGLRTDFYEFYWADIMVGNQLSQLGQLVKQMLFRKWSDVPDNVRSLYILYWIVVLAFLAPVFISLYYAIAAGKLHYFVAWSMVSAIGFWMVNAFVLPTYGDVARYALATPETVGKRQEVRDRGLRLLKSLNDDPDYDRVVVVSHSLGTIVAYDVLNLLWFECRPDPDNPPGQKAVKAMRDVNRFVKDMPNSVEQRDEFIAAQRKLFRQLSNPELEGTKPWKISDFITVGSPLTHANFLLSANDRAFADEKAERLYSLCPPAPDKEGGDTYLYHPRGSRKAYAHHAAVFAATAWTNIYDPADRIFWGDFISGPLREKFGYGINEIAVKMKWPGGSRFVTHTLYWNDDADSTLVSADHPNTVLSRHKKPHISTLREAISLEGING